MTEHEKPRRTHAQARAEMRAGIIREGTALLVENGVAGLSVREIARELGVSSSAIYRHVANRDELLTLLLVDIFTEVAAEVDGALAKVEAPAEQFAALARSLRSWAVANPEKWALAYGTPVQGYSAPREETTQPGTRVMVRLLQVIIDTYAQNPDSLPELGEPSEAFQEVLKVGAEDVGVGVRGPQALAAGAVAIELWAELVGLISAEIFNQLGTEIGRFSEEILERWIARNLRGLGLG